MYGFTNVFGQEIMIEGDLPLGTYLDLVKVK
jgi:hypothetical protein